jgi:hypothetical protein
VPFSPLFEEQSIATAIEAVVGLYQPNALARESQTEATRPPDRHLSKQIRTIGPMMCSNDCL